MSTIPYLELPLLPHPRYPTAYVTHSTHLLSPLAASVDLSEKQKPFFEITMLNEVCHVIPRLPVTLLRRKGKLLSTLIGLVPLSHFRSWLSLFPNPSTPWLGFSWMWIQRR